MTVKLLTLKPRQDVIADIEEIRTKEKKPKIVGYAAQATETILKIVPEGNLVARFQLTELQSFS